MRRYLWASLLAVMSAGLVACAGLLSHPRDEKLFFALQIEDRGLVLARPKLLGEVGRPVTMKLVDAGDPEHTRLSLQLEPKRIGKTYQVQIGMELAGRTEPLGGELQLHHGEERQVLLTGAQRRVLVRMLVMRVDSPEFEAYMELARREMARETS